MPPDTEPRADRDEASRPWRTHRLESPYQREPVRLRVLPPTTGAKSPRPTLYILPVEPLDADNYGDGLEEARRLDLPDRYGVVCVAPDFDRWPWYADHPVAADNRQESHLLETVVPYVEANYPVRPEGAARYLLGFSKSGWGAFTLLLRHPDRFARAAAWDAPLLLARDDRWCGSDVFGTKENFQQYRVTRLLEAEAARLGETSRFVLLGHGSFREHVAGAHDLMASLGIPHDYVDGPDRAHHWHSGWMETAAARLLRDFPA